MATFIRIFLLLVCVFVPGVCLGGGTVSLAEIDSLLRQKPSVRNFLMSSLDMDDTVMAALRFGPHTKLGGARMGPYMIQARPKIPKDASPLEVVICTDALFFDASGRATEDEINAVRLEEKMTAVILRELNSHGKIRGQNQGQAKSGSPISRRVKLSSFFSMRQN